MTTKSRYARVNRLTLAAILATLFMLQLGAAAYAAEGEEASEITKSDAAVGKIEQLISEQLPPWAQVEVLGVAVWQFIAAFICVLVGLMLKRISDFVFKKKIIPLTEKTPFALDTLIATAASKPVGYLFLIAGVACAFAILPLPEKPNVAGFVFSTLKVLVAADILWFLFRLVDVGAYYLAKLAERSDSKLDDQLIPLIRKALKATVGIVGAVWLIQLLGYKVSTLLAGLGIGGLAVALALQDTLANFFGSIFIFLDRPFAVGDRIKLGDVDGVVEDIGFRSTRVRTLPATLVSIPNKTVANATIDNLSKMPKRRVKQVVGVTYDTAAEQMEQAVAAIREIVETDEGVDEESITVCFTEFADSSLNILVCYFTKDVAYAEHAATRERINLAIMRKLSDMGLSMAFPTRTVHFEGEVAERLAERLGEKKPKGASEE
jgi:MscS family membrane protein